MNTSPSSLHDQLKALADTLGLLRAETLGDRVFDLFTEPTFFPELESGNSCFLIGGRGTGKTTLLRCLSFKGQAALKSGDARQVSSWSYFGMFFRIDIGKVRSFSGPELSADRWVKVFGHYANLEIVDVLLDLIEWLESEGLYGVVSGTTFSEVLSDLHSLPANGSVSTLKDARAALNRARRAFEAGINNIADDASSIKLSILGGPVKALVQDLLSDGRLQGKRLFFLIDEYENLLDYQQEVYNTLVKNVWEGCAFKIGVKPMGWRTRSTVWQGEALSSPADYARIDITERLTPRFAEFAERIVIGRLRKSPVFDVDSLPRMPDMFESISLDEEAKRLGIGEMRFRPPEPKSGVVAKRIASQYATLSRLQQLFCVEWARGRYDLWSESVRGLSTLDQAWIRRYNNYAYALLFSIRGGKPGRRKLYAGWKTICLLASGNIRYLLDLVSTMLARHLQGGSQLGTLLSAEMQTDVAQEVGRKNFHELERDSDDARRLQRLVLSLGRIFEVLAAKPIGYAPEVTQFALPSDDSGTGPVSPRSREIGKILDEGINAQALLRLHASKRQGPTDARAFDYMLHPVFAPFFDISHRRKRKVELREDEILGIIQEPKWEIRRVLQRLRRDPSEAPLPDQLRLFSAYYE